MADYKSSGILTHLPFVHFSTIKRKSKLFDNRLQY